MRAVLALTLLLATPAVAQSVQQQAAEIMVTDMVAEGFAPATSELVAQCFVSRMTDAEALSFIAADTLEAQQIVVAEMADTTQATLCVAEVLG